LVDKTIGTINRGIKDLPLSDLALRIVDISNRIGKALLFTRALLPIRRKAFLCGRCFGVGTYSERSADAFDCRRCLGRNPERSLGVLPG
jgi:hypothetical protein